MVLILQVCGPHFAKQVYEGKYRGETGISMFTEEQNQAVLSKSSKPIHVISNYFNHVIFPLTQGKSEFRQLPR